jgi:hypothetical protein
MSQSRIPLGLLALGLLLLVGSRLWSRDLGINRSYSDEDAAEYEEAVRNLHSLMQTTAHQAADPSRDDDHASEVDAAREQFNAARARRDAALERRSSGSALLRYAGILCLAAGVAGYLFLRHRG